LSNIDNTTDDLNLNLRPKKAGLVAEFSIVEDALGTKFTMPKVNKNKNNLADKTDSSISSFNLSKVQDYNDVTMKNNSNDLNMLLNGKDLDHPSTAVLLIADEMKCGDSTRSNSKDKQEKFLSVFSKDQAINYLCQACKANPQIHGTQCLNSDNKGCVSGDITCNCVFAEKAFSQTETIKTELEMTRHQFFKSTYLTKSKHAKERIHGDVSDIGTFSPKNQYSSRNGECIKRSEDFESNSTIVKSDINISSNNNIKTISDNFLLKDVNKMDKRTATLTPKDVWIDIKGETHQNKNSATETGDLTDIKVLKNVSFDRYSLQGDTSAQERDANSPISMSEERPKKELKDELNISEKWNTTKLAWKPSDNSVDKKFFITFPGIAFNIKDAQIRCYEDWRDAVLNNYVLRHSERNSILTVRTFDFLLRDLVKKRLMIRTRKGLKTIKSRRNREKKDRWNYQTLDADVDEGVTRDDVKEGLPSNDVEHGKSKNTKSSEPKGKLIDDEANKHDTEKKTKRKRRYTETRNKNIVMGYICMKIVRRFSKHIRIL
jgi:hypothetical protein